MNKPLVYIAGPYTKGNHNRNVHAHLDIFDRLLFSGVVTPIAPLLATLADLVNPQPYEKWMEYDLELLSHCDALLATFMNQESQGRDREIDYATKKDIPIFYSVDELVRWAVCWTSQQISI